MVWMLIVFPLFPSRGVPCRGARLINRLRLESRNSEPWIGRVFNSSRGVAAIGVGAQAVRLLPIRLTNMPSLIFTVMGISCGRVESLQQGGAKGRAQSK